MKRIVLITSMLVMILTVAFSNDSMARGWGFRGYAPGYVCAPRPRVVVTYGGGYGSNYGYNPYYRPSRGYDRRYDGYNRGRDDYNRGGYYRNNDYNRGGGYRNDGGYYGRR